MSPGSSTENYPAFAHIGLRENPGKNLNQGHLRCAVGIKRLRNTALKPQKNRKNKKKGLSLSLSPRRDETAATTRQNSVLGPDLRDAGWVSSYLASEWYEGDNAGEMSPGSSTESYLAFVHIGLRENPGKNLNQVTFPDRDSNPGHLVSQPDALTVTPQVWTSCNISGDNVIYDDDTTLYGDPKPYNEAFFKFG
ncbi:hypothetical protein ANN_05593 [Periplaneta americana]|uniref:Uncharacterized protein n=1 Tax=Periplaneta americana TaxID=6978 RepID=A0ABQ8TD52_PERAM|nr:hypothetical protein ANN_05593 [Periplaneta americana]